MITATEIDKFLIRVILRTRAGGGINFLSPLESTDLSDIAWNKMIDKIVPDKNKPY